MMHIDPKMLLPQDKVDVLDHATGEVMRMHASDAKHTLGVEPERYEIVMPSERPEPLSSSGVYGDE